MTDRVTLITEQALQLPADERAMLLEALRDSLGLTGSDHDHEWRDMAPDAKQRLGELWDEGIASGPGENLSMAELIEQAKSSGGSQRL